jgi:hypothetical protein
MPLIRKEKTSLGRCLLAETTRQGPDRAAILRDNAKYIYAPEFALNGRRFHEMFFDLASDPLEKTDLFAKLRERALTLAGELFSSGLYVERRAWRLSWGASPQAARLKGELRTSGKFIYEYKDNTIYGTDAKGLLVTKEFPWDKKEDNRLTFVNVTNDPNGITVMTEPETAPVTVELLFGGKEDPGRVLLGGPKNRAPSGHIVLSEPIAREPGVEPPPGGCLIWSESVWVNSKQVLRAEVGDPIKLSPEVIEHLRSLGYVQ